jgi:hypothetical protein
LQAAAESFPLPWIAPIGHSEITRNNVTIIINTFLFIQDPP